MFSRLRRLPADPSAYFCGACFAGFALAALVRWSLWALTGRGLEGALLLSFGTAMMLAPVVGCWQALGAADAAAAPAEGGGAISGSPFFWMYAGYAVAFVLWGTGETASLLARPDLDWRYKAGLAVALNLFGLMAVCWGRASLAARRCIGGGAG